MSVIRVLLADDHPALRAGIRERLDREADVTVLGEAATGEEALRMAAALRPHVLVLDMELPGLSGVEVARRVAADALPVRILALSAYDDEEYIAQVLDSGAAGYLTKQEPLDVVVAAVRGVARGEDGWLSRDAAARLMAHRRTRLRPADDPAGLLTEREREVLSLLAHGYPNQEIGERLFISESTVKKHVNNLYFKLEVNTRAGAVAWAWKHGMVHPGEA